VVFVIKREVRRLIVGLFAVMRPALAGTPG
jgi:hypothetical protein